MAQTATATSEDKPKFKLRKKHIKKAVMIALYVIVALSMVVSMIVPALTF